jgi:probable HAF family extracellular repeat protein
MTLNITVTSPHGIHQSADFRLTDFKRAPDGTLTEIEGNSPKIVAFSYKNWSGFLTYCGVGLWDGIPTYKSAADWIVSLGADATFDDVVGILEKNGSEWIRSIQDRRGQFQGHSFVLTAYANGLPRVGLVSNTHSTRGRFSIPEMGGLRSSIEGGSGTHVYITGMDDTVPESDRIAIRRMSEENVAPNELRARLAKVNESAAARSKNGISASCMCYSIDRLGEGAGSIYGKVIGPLDPIYITNGLNITELVAPALIDSSRQLKGLSFTTSAANNATAAEHLDCVLKLEGAKGVVVDHDFSDINNRHISICSANESGTIVGQMRRPVNEPPRAFVWIKGDEPLDLGTFGGAMSGATDVNSRNVVVGNAATADSLWRAFLWRDGAPILDLGTIHANNSSAVAINESEVVVGSVYGSPSQRAFRWTQSSGMELISGTEDHWSQALDINNNGDILGCCRVSQQMRSFVWSESTGLQLIGDANDPQFFATRINDAGIVIGEADDESGVRRGIIWSATSGLRMLDVPFSFSPLSIDNEGNIVGIDTNRPWYGAWLITANGVLLPLPGGRNHSVDARVIVGGRIYGHVRGDGWKHVHPIRWDFSVEGQPRKKGL